MAKAVIIDDQARLVGSGVIRSGVDFSVAAETVFAQALKQANLDRAVVKTVFATGYGRRNVAFAKEARTEIACHGLGCYHYFPEALTVIDIGGQDNKIIKLNPDGTRRGFKMNRKCAAGTGAFLEEMSVRLDLSLEKMNELAQGTVETVELGAFCTVFSATEVLEKIRSGAAVAGIVRGIYLSMVRRVIEMDSLENKVVLTGGVVAHNPILVEVLAQETDRPVAVPEHPQLTGALGAALLARQDRKIEGDSP